MKQVIFGCAFLAILIPASCSVVVRPRYPHEAESLSVARASSPHSEIVNRVRSHDFVPSLQKRADNSTQLGSFDLGVHVTNDSLFSVALSAGSGSVSLSASCVNCFTNGTGIASTHGFKSNDALLEDVVKATEELAKDPQAFIASALDMNILIELENLSGHFEFDVNFGSSGSITVPLFSPITPLGGEIAGNEVGVIFSIDLVFSVSETIDFRAGFDVNFPQGAWFIINPLSGELLSMNVDGVEVSGIPFTFNAGQSSFSVALRVGLKTGLGVKVLGTGFDIEAGIYVDVPTYQAAIVYDPEAHCQLAFTEGFSGDAAAYAQFGVSIDYVGWSPGPSTAVTFWTGQLPGGCIASSTSLPISTTTNTIKPTAAAVYGNSSAGTSTRTFNTTRVTHGQKTGTSTAPLGVVITSPAAVSILASLITGSFVSGTSALTVIAPPGSSQAIAPASQLLPGNDVPITTINTPLPGFVGAQASSSTTGILNSTEPTITASIITPGVSNVANATTPGVSPSQTFSQSEGSMGRPSLPVFLISIFAILYCSVLS